MKKIILSSLFAAVVLFFGTAIAQEVASTPQGTIVAEVNTQDISVISRQGNTVTFSFTLKNGNGVQNKVKYAAVLVSDSSSEQTTLDEYVYKESLTLLPNSSTTREVSYTVPEALPSGTYKLFIITGNEQGFPLGAGFVSDVTIVSENKSVFLDPSSCVFQNSGGRSVSTDQTALFSPSETVVIRCVLTNLSPETTVLRPSLVVREESMFGREIEAPVLSDEITLASGEKKQATFSLPLQSTPGTYYFSATWGKTNTITGTYRVSGPTASIRNISLDASEYKKGETARLLVIWNASLVDNSVVAKATPDVVLEATIKNSSGLLCTKPIKQRLSRAAPMPTRIIVPVVRNCLSPSVSMTLSDLSGTILDDETFVTKMSAEGNTTTAIVVFAGIIILLGIGIYMNKKEKKVSVPPVTLFVLLLGVGMILSSKPVAAVSYSHTAANGDVIETVVDLNAATYAPNSPITVTSIIYNHSDPLVANVSYPVTLTARNNGGSPFSLIPQTTLPAGDDTGYRFYSGFSTPGSGGSYSISFETGIDEPEPPTLSLVNFGATQGWLDPIGTPAWEASVTISAPSAGETFDVRFDTYINGYYSGTETLTVITGQSPWPIGNDAGITQGRELQSYQTYWADKACIASAPPTVYVDPSYLCN